MTLKRRQKGSEVEWPERWVLALEVDGIAGAANAIAVAPPR